MTLPRQFWDTPERIDALPTGHIVARGISIVPENRRIFPEMTVLENLEMGAYLRRDREGIEEDLERIFGLFPVLVERIFELIQEIHRQGTTVFVVEQNANMALSIADRGYVLQTGRIVLADTAPNLLQNEMIRKAYLGT